MLDRAPTRAYSIELFTTDNSDPARMERSCSGRATSSSSGTLFIIPMENAGGFRLRVMYGEFPTRDQAAVAVKAPSAAVSGSLPDRAAQFWRAAQSNLKREDKKSLRDRRLHHFPQAILMVCLPPEGVLTMTLGDWVRPHCSRRSQRAAVTRRRSQRPRTSGPPKRAPRPTSLRRCRSRRSCPSPSRAARPETYSVVVNNVRVAGAALCARARRAPQRRHPSRTSRHGDAQRHRPDAASAPHRIARQVDMRYEIDGETAWW